MRVSAASLALAFATSVSAAIKPNADLSDSNAGRTLPGAYIVEFEPGQESADDFYKNLTSNGIDAQRRQTFQPNIFAGTSFRLTADKKADLDVIGEFKQVKRVTPVRLYSTQAPSGDLYKNVDWKKVERSLGKRDATLQNDTQTTHVMTGVDKLHAEGLDGSGITVAVIDTGIDYTLKALGGGFGPGYKVAFGTDLVGDDYDGFNTPVPDDDPMDCAGHGTHVSGILGASNDPYVLGVAPNVTIGIYKVFGCEGQTSDEVLIQAFTMAFNHGVDLITASIGGASGWSEEPWTAATQAIVKAGTPCMLSAGNDGANGIFYGSSAADGHDVTAIGSVDNTNSPQVLNEASYTVSDSTNETFGYTPAYGDFAGVSLPLWTSSTNTSITDDGCTGFGDVDLTGKIALIRRGTCQFTVKAGNAVAAGAQYVMFYNNVPGTISASVEGVDGLIAAGMVDPATGATWVSDLAAGETVVLTFPDTVNLYILSPGVVNTVTGGHMSTYTSWYTTNEADMHPIVSAPGGNILSTYPADKGGYGVLSGTSMAAPFIAGVVALYKQSKGEITSGAALNAALASSSRPLNFNDGANTYDWVAPAIQQGGGLIDAYKLIHTPLTVSTATISLNDTEHRVTATTFDVTNNGDSIQTVTLGHSPAGNAYSFITADDALVAEFPPPQDTEYATAVIEPSTLVLAPGESGKVVVSITPAALDPSLVPVFSGYITIADGTSNTSSLSIPYAGVAASLHDVQILEPGQGYPILDTELAISNSTSQGPYGNASATFKPSEDSYPIIIFNNRWGTKEIRLDVVSLDNATSNDNVTAGGLATAGSVPQFPLLWQPRGIAGQNTTVGWNGSLAGENAVSSGTYEFVLRFAKVFGEDGDYEEYKSDSFYMDMS